MMWAVGFRKFLIRLEIAALSLIELQDASLLKGPIDNFLTSLLRGTVG